MQTCSIIQYLPARIQVGLFSGAFSSEALETSHWFMDDDKHVTIKVPRREELKDIGTKQFYRRRRVDSKEEKLGALYGALLDALEPAARTVVFANTKRGVRTQLMQYISRVQQQRRCSGTGSSVAISFVTPADERVLRDVQRFCNGQISKLPSNPSYGLLVSSELRRSEMFLNVSARALQFLISSLHPHTHTHKQNLPGVCCDMRSLVS
jgi:superfamily II DNA/RNA helicase